MAADFFAAYRLVDWLERIGLLSCEAFWYVRTQRLCKPWSRIASPAFAADQHTELWPFDDEGNVNVRIVYDHRVLDGATVARALARLEEVLTGEIAVELERMERANNAKLNRKTA